MEAQKVEKEGEYWRAELFDTINKRSYSVRTKVLINACGPFVDGFNAANGISTQHRHVFSKGIHLIVDRITSVKKVLAFFAADGRLFFVIPMGPKTCIGTTDTKVTSPHTQVSDDDRDFVLDNVNRMLDLETPLTRASIIAERCGVRPLAVVGQDTATEWVQLSRKHAIDVDHEARLLSIFGGKLTDCVNVGDEVAGLVESFGIALHDIKSPQGRSWYGESPASQKEAFMAEAAAMSLNDMSRPDIHEKLSDRLWRRYDKNAFAMLDAIRKDKSQADIMIPNTEYRRCELHYIAQNEMVTKLDDFLRRRSKISLILRKDALCHRETLQAACDILFGDKADERLEEYLQSCEG